LSLDPSAPTSGWISKSFLGSSTSFSKLIGGEDLRFLPFRSTAPPLGPSPPMRV
jgi:hypothetical protein